MPDFIHSHHHRVTQGAGIICTSLKLVINRLIELHALRENLDGYWGGKDEPEESQEIMKLWGHGEQEANQSLIQS